MLYTTTSITSLEEARSIQKQWNALAKKLSHYSIFLTAQCMLATFEHFFAQTHTLCIVCIWEGEELVGLLPTAVRNDTAHILAHLDVTDYADVILDPTKDTLKVLEAGCSHLKTQGISKLNCISLHPDSQTPGLFEKLYPTSRTQQEVVPQIKLPADWETYLGSLKRKQRHEVRRKWRKLEELEHTFEIHTSVQKGDDNWHTFLKLHKASSKDKEQFWTIDKTAFFAKIIEAASQENALELHILSIEKTPVATMLLFKTPTEKLLYNSGYDPEAFPSIGTGIVLTAYTIKHAIECEAHIYDFLRGDEEYKFRFGAIAKPLVDLEATLR